MPNKLKLKLKLSVSFGHYFTFLSHKVVNKSSVAVYILPYI